LRRNFRHQNQSLKSERLRRVSDGFGVISAADGDDAALFFFVIKSQHFVKRAANFERAGVLQKLVF